jgi:hypothetical protein
VGAVTPALFCIKAHSKAIAARVNLIGCLITQARRTD